MKTETVQHTATIKGGSLIVTTTKQYVIPNPGAALAAVIGDRVQTLTDEAVTAILLDQARPRLRLLTPREKRKAQGFTDARSALEALLGRKQSRKLARLLRKYGVVAVNRLSSGELAITGEKAISSNWKPLAIASTGAVNLQPEPRRAEVLGLLSETKKFGDYLTVATAAEIVDLPKYGQAIVAVTDQGTTFAVAPETPAYKRRGDTKRK